MNQRGCEDHEPQRHQTAWLGESQPSRVLGGPMEGRSEMNPMRFVGVLASALWLTGCETPRQWHGPQASKDLYECQVDAARVYAAAHQIVHQTAGYVPPAFNFSCTAKDSSTRCTSWNSAQYVPPPITVDLNQEKREQLVTQCMRARGNLLLQP